MSTHDAERAAPSRQAPCAACGQGADEVLLCAGCLARAHPACWIGACPGCGETGAPLGPVRAGQGTPAVPSLRIVSPPPPRRGWRVRRRRVAVAAALALGGAWFLLAGGEQRPPDRVRLASPTRALVFERAELPNEAGSPFSRAFDATKRGDLPAAIGLYSQALELDPRWPGAWNNRGWCRLMLGDHAGAIADCTRALELSPRAAYPWNNRARARLLLGDLAGAEGDVAVSLALDPRNCWAWETRAMLRAEQGRWPEARDDVRRARELDTKGERGAALDALAARSAVAAGEWGDESADAWAAAGDGF